MKRQNGMDLIIIAHINSGDVAAGEIELVHLLYVKPWPLSITEPGSAPFRSLRACVMPIQPADSEVTLRPSGLPIRIVIVGTTLWGSSITTYISYTMICKKKSTLFLFYYQDL